MYSVMHEHSKYTNHLKFCIVNIEILPIADMKVYPALWLINLVLTVVT